ncbi:MAG: DEAD/DEAH box helicase, partial [Chlorobiales bacterium]|nr:DEAD/DEAH box helicase [Chlorobiales bacterium]
KQLRELDRRRDEAWRSYDSTAKEIEQQKDTLLDTVEERLKQTIEEKTLFTITWSLT